MTARPRLRRVLPAGLIDASFASAATFSVGVYAAAVLDANDLGTYAVYMTAFLAAVAFPRQFVFIPAEVVAISDPAATRIGLVPQTLRIGLLPCLAAAVVAVVASIIVTGGGGSDAFPYALTMGGALVISPMQDHLRRMFHLAGRSWTAAGVSTIQIVTIIASIVGLNLAGVEVAWIPFGSLLIANAVSLAAALALAAASHSTPIQVIHFRDLVGSGSRLAVVGLLPAITGFVAASLLLAEEGNAELGYAEASRVVSRPILVLGTGLFAAMRPRSLEAAVALDEPRARSISRIFGAIMIGAAAAVVMLIGFEWPWNLLASAIPNAYVVTGLVAAFILAQTAEGLTRPLRAELTAGRRETTLVRIEVVGNVIRLGIAAMAGLLGAFVLPVGVFALAAVRFVAYHRTLAVMYRQSHMKVV